MADNDEDKDKNLDDDQSGADESDDSKDTEAGESDAEDNKTDDSDKSEEDNKSDSGKEEDEDPKPRKSVRQHIIERKAKAYDKSKSKDDDDDDDGPSVSDKAKEAISKELDPVFDLVQKQEDERELQALFAKFPDSKEMETQIRKHMDVYKDAPVEFIYNALAGKRDRLNAKKKAADEEASKDRTGGHSRRPKESDSKLKPADDLSEEEFQKVVSKTLSS